MLSEQWELRKFYINGIFSQIHIHSSRIKMKAKKFPILEFDSAREAIIEPSKVVKSLDVPEHCVITFFQEVLEKLHETGKSKIIAHNKWADMDRPLYELEFNGKRIAAFHPGVGASLTCGILEETIARGGRKFIACGGCGVLDRDIAVGHLIVPTTAVRDEGTSYHYLPPERESQASSQAVAAIEKVIQSYKIPYLLGKTWTTDAPYRETPEKVKLRKSEGCLTVEMEAAAFFAVAQFRGVTLGQILYGGDDVSGEGEWDNREWHAQFDIREKLFWLAVESCLRL
jgi:uridine phosphorylase